LRGTIKKIAAGEVSTMPATIDDSKDKGSPIVRDSHFVRSSP
jgi:hypothetical protein